MLRVYSIMSTGIFGLDWWYE